jgi:hypothetical protein
MANICSFEMHLRGSEENIKAMVDALEQKGDIWVGRGAEIFIMAEEDMGNDYYVECIGDTKWSIQNSLIDDAHSMERQRTTGEGCWCWEGNIKDVKEFLDIFEACARFHVNMEAYSREEGMEIVEHMKFENGVITNEGGYGGWDFCIEEVDDAKIEEASKNGKDEMEL